MKHRFKKMMSLTLCLALSASIMSPALAAENDATQTSPVKLTAQPIVFNVTVPSGLPVDVDSKGEVTVATNVKIENHSAAPITIAGVQVNPIVDWSIVPMNKDFHGSKIGTKEFGFVLNSDEVPANGAVTLTKANWPSINGGSNLPLVYDSVVAPQKDTINSNKIADVVFTIGWDVNDFTLSSETLSIDKGASSKLNLLGADSAEWSSSNESVATVDQTGLVTTLDWGTTTITATTNGVSKTCEVTVPKIQTGLEIDIASKILAPNETIQLTATSKFRAGTIWSSSNPEIVTVDQTGLVTGKSAGTATITATQGEFSATCYVTVTPAIGTKYTEGNYEYSYGQKYKNGSWVNSNLNGWGVKILDNTQTSYVQPLEEVQNWPVTNYTYLFQNYPNYSLTLEGIWTNKNVTDMSYMFGDSKAKSLDLSSFNTSNVTDMRFMFSSSLVTSLDLSGFNTSNVTNMNSMFTYLRATSIDLSGFDTSKVTDMFRMFRMAEVTSLDLSSFDVSNVIDMKSMFEFSSTKTGYARTQIDADKFNATNKPSALTFVVKPV